MTENDQRVQASSDSFVGIVVAGTRNMLNTQVFFVCVCACVCACMRTCVRAWVVGLIVALPLSQLRESSRTAHRCSHRTFPRYEADTRELCFLT